MLLHGYEEVKKRIGDMVRRLNVENAMLCERSEVNTRRCNKPRFNNDSGLGLVYVVLPGVPKRMVARPSAVGPSRISQRPGYRDPPGLEPRNSDSVVAESL